ncbi:MAG: hypothetical protein ACLP1Q_14040 [Solirubrobacteraceae bacterium]
MATQAALNELRQLAPDIYWRHAWEIVGERYPAPPPPGPADGERRIRRELLFCLLGGHGVPYELNLSASDLLWERGLFRHWRPNPHTLESELSREQFMPERRDGTPRRYRYPRRAAGLLSQAGRWLAHNSPLFEALALLAGERDRRQLLCECPGIGPKSASWLLRNCGLAHELAILDVHVLRMMRESGRMAEHDGGGSDYEALEQTFVSWCRELGAEPAGFDLLLWEFSRAGAA